MDASTAAGGYAAAGQAVAGFISARGQGQVAKIQAGAANEIRAINNETVAVVNKRNAALTSLQRWAQDVRNSRVMENVAANQEALATNFNRQRDARTRQNFADNIRQAEQSGRQQAAAAVSGVTGSVVDVLDQTSRLKAAMQNQTRVETEKQLGMDFNKQEFAQRQAMMDQLDHTLIFDNTQLLDYRTTLPANTVNPFSAAIASTGVKGIQAGINFFDAAFKTDYGLGAPRPLVHKEWETDSMAEPQVNPNALSAPAEGFGQTVTFAFNPAGEPPQQRPIQQTGPRVGATGGTQQAQLADSRAAYAPIVEDPTAALLMKAGEAVLSKRLDEARTEQFIKGMQQSMAGVGIEEVKAQAPWYSKIFGDTPAIEGARAYQAQDTVNRTVAEQAANMPKLASMDPEQAGKHFTNVMTKALTGDAGTDQLIMKQMAEAMPGLMKTQAKANYGYNQQRAATAMSASILSGSEALQALGESYAAGHVSKEDMDVRSKQFVMSALPPEGIDEENYQKNLTKTMLGMAAKGQFHALEALKTSGVTSALTTEQANRVESASLSQATKARDNYSFKYSDVIAKLQHRSHYPDPGQTAESYSKEIDQANEAFQKLTGSPVGLFSSDQKASMVAGHLNAFSAEEDKMRTAAATLAKTNATATDKAAAKEAQVAGIRELVGKGQIELAKAVDGVSGDDVDIEVMKMSKQDPTAAMKFLPQAWNQNRGYVNKFIASEIQAPLNQAYAVLGEQPSAPPPDSWFQAVENYRALVKQGGLAYANDYYGTHAKALSYASSQLGNDVLNNPRAPDIFRGSANIKSFDGQDLTAKETEGILTRVTKEGTSFWHKATLGLAGDQIRPDTARFLANDVTRSANQWMATGLSKDEAVNVAVQEMMGKGGKGGQAEIIGGFYVKREPGSTEPRLADLMRGGNGRPVVAVPDEETGPIFKEFLKDKLQVPNDMGTTQIYRLPNAGGTPRFIISGQQPEGKHFVAEFGASELQDFSAERMKWRRRGSASTRAIGEDEYQAYNADIARREATPYQPLYSFDGKPAGVGTYFGPMPRKGEQTPSIYMDAEKRAAYRAEQQRKFK